MINELNDIVNKYNNTYHRTMKMKPVNVKSSTYIDSSKEINDKDTKFKIADIVRIPKYKNSFVKGYVSNWSKKVFVIKKLKVIYRGLVLLAILTAIKIFETFYEKELQKANKKGFRVEKVIKRKSDKLYIKWKNYNSSLNSWIDQKDIV